MSEMLPTNTPLPCAPYHHCVSLQTDCNMHYSFRLSTLKGGVPCAVRALCEKLAVLHHREFGKFRRLKGRH